MARVKLIKRKEVTTQKKQASHKTASTRATVQEWVKEYQAAKPNSAHVAYAALFVPIQIG